jgi:hypothetical protein
VTSKVEELVIGTVKVTFFEFPPPLGLIHIIPAIFPVWCAGKLTVAIRDNVTGVAEPFNIEVFAIEIVPEPDVIAEFSNVRLAASPEFVTLKATENEPALCAVADGAETRDAVSDAALAKLIRNNAANIATKDKMAFLFVILCCNFVITLVYKYFYF